MVAVSLKKSFFQAEDGIRDVAVTGVQTCALPILISLDEYLKKNSVVVSPEDPENPGEGGGEGGGGVTPDPSV